MDLQKVCTELTEVMAKQIHYLENINSINRLHHAYEVMEAVEGGIDRYKTDTMYKAKVDSTVAIVMEIIRANDKPE